MLKNRYGLFRRPPRDPGKRLADGEPRYDKELH
jgi:hypothetical protein